MRRCFQLAQLGAGTVAPNPMVGAILVNEDHIIGEGYHQFYGQAHAEVNCINSVAEKDQHLIPASTLYVSLEPCAHFGKTPPCADLIINKKIPRVVVACRDSFDQVDGKGIRKMRDAGIEVINPLLEKEALELNKRFFTFHRQQRPFIILKWAQTADRMIANNDRSRLLISNPFTNRLVHRWRTEEAAIMIGTQTAFHDDPSLTARLWPGYNPTRLVIDRDLQLPATHHLFSGEAKTIVFNTVKQADDGTVRFEKLADKKDLLEQIMESLYRQNVQSVLVEGGAKLLQSFIDAGCWNEARVITNTLLVAPSGLSAPHLANAELESTTKLFSDEISFYKRMTKE